MSKTFDELPLDDPSATSAAIDALASGAIMLQMPAVFVLLAPPNDEGSAWLDVAKQRLPGKNYGTAVGRMEPFHALALPGALPHELAGPASLQVLTGSFIRFSVADAATDTPMVRKGTHQGLVIDGAHRDLFVAIEEGLAHVAQPSIIGGHTYTAPLCTSANYSGHPDGSIVDGTVARAFAAERGVRLLITAPADPSARGSYPIFWLRPDYVTVERDGPGRERLEAMLPRRLMQRDASS